MDIEYGIPMEKMAESGPTGLGLGVCHWFEYPSAIKKTTYRKFLREGGERNWGEGLDLNPFLNTHPIEMILYQKVEGNVLLLVFWEVCWIGIPASLGWNFIKSMII